MAPTKPMGRVLNVGFSFFTLILGATYTANLATFLISSGSLTVKFTSLDDANTHRIDVCVQSGTYAASVLQSYYPLVPTTIIPSGPNSVQVMLDAMLSGQCSAAVLQQVEWDLNQFNVDRNCKIAVAGSSVRSLAGSLAYHHDYFDKCTSMVQDVIDQILETMKADGTFIDLWNKAIVQSANIQCPAIQGLSPSSSLGIANLAGLFYVYFICVGLAVLVGMYHFVRDAGIDMGYFPQKGFGSAFYAAVKASIRRLITGEMDSLGFVVWNDRLDVHLTLQVELHTNIDYATIAENLTAAAKLMKLPYAMDTLDCEDRWAQLACADIVDIDLSDEQDDSMMQPVTANVTSAGSSRYPWNEILDLGLLQQVSSLANLNIDFEKVSEKMRLAAAMELCLSSADPTASVVDPSITLHMSPAACERRWYELNSGDIAAGAQLVKRIAWRTKGTSRADTNATATRAWTTRDRATSYKVVPV